MSFLSPIGVVYSVENLENKFFFRIFANNKFI